MSDAEAAQERADRVAESRAKWGSLQVAPNRVDPFADVDVVNRMATMTRR